MSAAGDTVELSPSGNHTWFAGKSAFYDFPSKLNLHLWDFPAMFDYQRMIALRLYEYCLVVDEFREKKTMSEKTRYWCIECGWHPRWNPENPLKSHSNEMNCEVMLWYPVFTWLCLNIGYLQNSLLTVIIIFRDHHPKKSDTALCYHSSQICYISPHENPWTGWLLQCAPPSSYKLVYTPQ